MDEIEKIKSKLNEIKVFVNEIRSKLPQTLDRYLSSEFVLKRAFERDLQLISDTEMEILALLARLKDVGIAATDSGLIDKFRNILTSKTLEYVRELRRLRNTLTHAYADRKYDEKVYYSANKLESVEVFLEEVEKIVKSLRKV